MHNVVQCSAVCAHCTIQCSVVQCSIVQSSVVLCSTYQYFAMSCSLLQSPVINQTVTMHFILQQSSVSQSEIGSNSKLLVLVNSKPESSNNRLFYLRNIQKIFAKIQFKTDQKLLPAMLAFFQFLWRGLGNVSFLLSLGKIEVIFCFLWLLAVFGVQ